MFVKSGLFHLRDRERVTSGRVKNVSIAEASVQGIAFCYGQLPEGYV